MATATIGTPQQLRDPDYTPPLAQAVPLGIQHVLAMFVSNVTPAIIVAGAAGFGFGSGSPDFPMLIYMIQMSMLFAGVATLIQTIGIGPVGARLPIVQGTSFAFLPIMIPLVAGKGVDAMAAVTGGVLVGGLFHAALGRVVGRIRFALPPLVTGLVVLMIGLALVRVGIQYAAGGVPRIGTPAYGSLQSWSVALVVVFVTLGVKFFARGMWSIAAVLIGILAGYAVAFALGMVSLANVGTASWVALPRIFLRTALMTSAVLMIVATASVFAWLLTVLRLPQAATAWILSLGLSDILLLLAIALFLLVCGLFIDTLPGVLLFVPIIAPMADAVGLNPGQTALVVILSLTMGMITPPVGGVLFVVTAVSGVPLARVIGAVWPFFFAIFAVLLLLILVPGVATWLPGQFGYRFD